MRTLGVILMVVPVIVALVIIFYFVIRKKRQIQALEKESKKDLEILPSDIEDGHEKKLKVVQSGQTVALLGESERQISAAVTLHEMTQRKSDSSWINKGMVSRGLVLSVGIFIFKMPSREDGKPIWLKAEELDVLPLRPFYAGSEEVPGPRRLFHQKQQSTPIPYQLPGDLIPDIIWLVVDIGTLNVEVDGESENFKQNDRLYFVTSTEKGGNRRLIYFDAREKEALGTGGLFLCEPFAPTIDIKEIL